MKLCVTGWNQFCDPYQFEDIMGDLDFHPEAIYTPHLGKTDILAEKWAYDRGIPVHSWPLPLHLSMKHNAKARIIRDNWLAKHADELLVLSREGYKENGWLQSNFERKGKKITIVVVRKVEK